jgi:PAS domain S-box-containing protein
VDDECKTREELLEELLKLRRRNAALERSAAALQDAEAALRESEQRYRNIFENAVEGIFQATAEGKYLSVNPAFARMCGFGSPEEMIDEITDIARQLYLDARDRSRIKRLYEHPGVVRGFETRFRRKDGGVIWVSITARSVKDETGNVLYYEGTIEDITERKLAEEALRGSEGRLADIINFLPDATFVIDTAGNVIAWNRAMEEMTGLKAEQMVGKGGYEHAIPFYGTRRPVLINLALASDEEAEKLYPYIARDGDILVSETYVARLKGGLHLWLKASPLYDSSGNVVGAIESARDVTARKRAEEALRESEERYRQLFEMESDAIFLVDNATGAILEVNASACGLYGYSREEMLRVKNTDLSAEPEDTTAATRQRRPRVPVRYHRRKDGTVFPVEITARHFNWRGREVHVAAVRDISFRMEAEEEKRRLQAQLLQAQKMEAIGTLAGGLAHDFNNLLQAVQGYAELVLLVKKKDEPGQRELHEIIRAAKRGTELTRQLLTFSRKVESKLQPMDVNRRVEQVKELLARTIPKMIEIELRLADDLKIVDADPTQIEQVLMNLAVNAKDAMPEGGKLFIETRNVSLDKGYCDTHLGVKPGDYVLLMVSDTGYGMDQETLEHIFEPFFTTKGVGRGTGLGLAMVYGIVKSHNGYITCYSEIGHGTTFKIYLPTVEEAPEVPRDRVERLPEGGTETILLVDDEESVRELGKEMLETVGYHVLTCSDGEEAMGLYTQRMGDIHLVLLDLIMPGMGGKSCLDALLRLDPRVKVLIASGYSVNGRLEDTLRSGARGFISKPYELRELLQRVRDILDEDRAGP